MKPAGLIERLDDSLNPIVVKELRQAVHSRFVTAVLMFFLIMQLLFIGIHLMFVAAGGQIESIEFQAGREVFTALQVILLATCMLFLPLYAGIRLAAERNETNTDLLFITTLRPRSIISGKLVSSIIVALLIFSACAPFMAFTYFLRGIDWPSILFILAMDFVVVIASVQVMIFLAVVPANRLFKAFLGLIGFAVLVFVFSMTLAGSINLIWLGLAPAFQDREFWVIVGTISLGIFGGSGLFFAWSVALISPPTSNRALPVRLYLLAFWLVFGVLMWLASVYLGHDSPIAVWVGSMNLLLALNIIIAINEREQWTPRVARGIPQNRLLRPLVFLFYSGAASGILFSVVLAAWTSLVALIFHDLYTHGAVALLLPSTTGMRWDILMDTFKVTGVLVLYVYCYGMTAVLIRSWLFRSVPAAFTWIVMLVVTALGSLVPFLISFLIFYSSWRYESHFTSLLGNPGAAMIEIGMGPRGVHGDVFIFFAAGWAALVTLLCVPWYFTQLRRFRPPTTIATAPVSIAPSALTAAPHDSTRTAPSAR